MHYTSPMTMKRENDTRVTRNTRQVVARIPWPLYRKLAKESMDKTQTWVIIAALKRYFRQP